MQNHTASANYGAYLENLSIFKRSVFQRNPLSKRISYKKMAEVMCRDSFEAAYSKLLRRLHFSFPLK